MHDQINQQFVIIKKFAGIYFDLRAFLISQNNDQSLSSYQYINKKFNKLVWLAQQLEKHSFEIEQLPFQTLFRYAQRLQLILGPYLPSAKLYKEFEFTSFCQLWEQNPEQAILALYRFIRTSVNYLETKIRQFRIDLSNSHHFNAIRRHSRLLAFKKKSIIFQSVFARNNKINSSCSTTIVKQSPPTKEAHVNQVKPDFCKPKQYNFNHTSYLQQKALFHYVQKIKSKQTQGQKGPLYRKKPKKCLSKLQQMRLKFQSLQERLEIKKIPVLRLQISQGSFIKKSKTFSNPFASVF